MLWRRTQCGVPLPLPLVSTPLHPSPRTSPFPSLTYLHTHTHTRNHPPTHNQLHTPSSMAPPSLTVAPYLPLRINNNQPPRPLLSPDPQATQIIVAIALFATDHIYCTNTHVVYCWMTLCTLCHSTHIKQSNSLTTRLKNAFCRDKMSICARNLRSSGAVYNFTVCASEVQVYARAAGTSSGSGTARRTTQLKSRDKIIVPVHRS